MSWMIKVDSVSKMYRLGTIGTGTIQDDLKRFWANIRGKENPFLKVGEANKRDQEGGDYVMALEDISFEVEKGKVLGIIGKNGAGKSTLLKILSKVTKPTEGKIITKGRIASLLEVGTGFHPELTGLENIYLNGAILGMTKKEIKSKLDEIIEFSGCKRYIDTPVKRYSSGMYVRLAFAVAAHLEPEILIVDEVLAVGDAEFQKKCLGKMKDVSSQGRTVIFVSHNMAAVKSLCDTAIILENGKISYSGDTETAVSNYINSQAAQEKLNVQFKEQPFKEFFLNSVVLSNDSDLEITDQDEITLSTNITINEDPSRFHLTYHLHNSLGTTLFSFSNESTPLQMGENELHCHFPKRFFQSGNYSLSLYIVHDQWYAKQHLPDIIRFSVVDSKIELGNYMGREPGDIRPKFSWTKKT